MSHNRRFAAPPNVREQGSLLLWQYSRRRDRPSRKSFDSSGRAGPFFHAAVLLETVRNWKGKYARAHHVAAGSFFSRDSASRAERLSADETIRTRLPIVSISKPNANGAAACAIRAGAPIMPRR
jgi:hypothetical protein